MIDNILDYLRDFSTYDFLFLGAIIVISIILIVLIVFKTRKRDEIYERTEEVTKKIDEPEVKMALASNEVINIPGLKSDIVNIPTEEIIEIPTVKQEILTEKIEIAEPITEMEKLLSMMQKDLEVNNRTDAVEMFEKEQEENAIISYKELLSTKDGKVEADSVSPVEKFSEFLDEPIVIEDEVVVLEEPKVEERVINNKFINSEFISPIFGRLETKNEYETVKKEVIVESVKPNIPEKNIVVEALSEEIVKNDEFLNALKDFRKNL